jgi:hypothetical protein
MKVAIPSRVKYNKVEAIDIQELKRDKTGNAIGDITNDMLVIARNQ